MEGRGRSPCWVVSLRVVFQVVHLNSNDLTGEFVDHQRGVLDIRCRDKENDNVPIRGIRKSDSELVSLQAINGLQAMRIR